MIEENWMTYVLDEFESRKINCINEEVESWDLTHHHHHLRCHEQFDSALSAINDVLNWRVHLHEDHSYWEASNSISIIAIIQKCQEIDELQSIMKADIDVHDSNQESAWLS